MGYITRDIAVITEPKKVSLAANPNFIIFESKPRTRVFLEADITVNLTPAMAGVSGIVITDPEGGSHTFEGTTDLAKVSGSMFYVSGNKDETAQNIKNALLSDRWIDSHFDIKVPFSSAGGNITNGTTVNIRSRGAGRPYNITIALDSSAYTLAWIHSKSENNDSITGEDVSTEIELDVYDNTGVFLGSEDSLTDSDTLGTPLTSIQKTYAGGPLWFELNALMSKKTGYSVPSGTGWFKTGTMTDYRFIAKVRGGSSFPFYYSNVLHTLNGYGYSLEPTDLAPYIYSGEGTVKLLTNKLFNKHIKGQKEFINFIFSDKHRGEDLGEDEYAIGVSYKLYTFGGEYITTIRDHEIPRTELDTVNTCVIDLSGILEAYVNTGRVEITLTRNGADISEGLRLEIIPECLHRLNEFIFLNKLGGWESFNVDAETKEDNKQTSSTYTKTLTPKLRIGDSLETVYNVELGITYTLETPPLDTDTRLWLRELVASPVIFDGNGNYIILEDAKLPISSDMDTLSLKYRLSDKYNG